MTDVIENVAAEAVAPETAPIVNEAIEKPAKIEATPRDAVDRAFASLRAAEKETDAGEPVAAKPEEAPLEAKPEAKADEPAKTEAKADVFEAPSRFSPDAKAAWNDAPAPIKAEVNRAIRELEGGISEYKQAFEPYREFDKTLKAQGQSFEQVIGHYTGIETLLANDPLTGLEQICRNLGTSLKDVAAHVMGQPVDQRASQEQAYTRQLEAKIQQLESKVSSVSSHIENTTKAQTQAEIDAFAKDKPRFAELSATMAQLLQSDMADDLADAYTKAERLIPAPVAPAPAAPAVTNKPDAAQTRKGSLSVTGAPASGSNPAYRQAPATANDAVSRAFAQLGLG